MVVYFSSLKILTFSAILANYQSQTVVSFVNNVDQDIALYQLSAAFAKLPWLRPHNWLGLFVIFFLYQYSKQYLLKSNFHSCRLL